MAITSSIKNENPINACENAGDWTGSTPNDVTDFFKEGTQCVGFEFWKSGDNDSYITVTEDLSGTTHLRMWFMCTTLKELNTDANGGIQVYLGDGSNTGYWYVSGSDTYLGGWYNLVVDLSAAVDAGTKPTMTTITTLGVRVNLTTGAKKAQCAWLDNIYAGDGIIIYGDDGGGYFDFADILAEDENTANGWGIIRQIGGVYYLNGSIDFGDASGTAGCKFKDASQVVIFEDRPVNSGLYEFLVVDNGTGTTEFILGVKSGTAGVQGLVVRVEDAAQLAKFVIDGTDADVDNFQLYGCQFYGAGTISFPGAATNVEILGCTFEYCSQVIADDASIAGCFFINTADTDAALLWNENIDISDCGFIANTVGAGIENPSAAGSPYDHVGLTFSGNTFDILNSSGSAIIIEKDVNSDASTSEGSAVTFIATKTIAVHVEDETGNDLEDAQVYIQKSTPQQYTSAAGNAQGDLDFIVTEAIESDVPISGWLKIHDTSLNKDHWYRYASVNSGTKTFALNGKVSGTCEAGGSTTLLNDTGIGAMDVQEGDTIRNETAGGWAVVRTVSADSITTTPLSAGTWANGETWSVHSLAVAYVSAEDFAYTPVMNERTNASGDAEVSWNYQGIRPILVKIRHSPEAGTKYEPFSTVGSIGAGGYSLDVILKEDDIAA